MEKSELPQIPEPGEESDHDCDCGALERWKTYSHVSSAINVLLIIGCIMMGLALKNRDTALKLMDEKLQTTPADVLERVAVLENKFQTTPADVIERLVVTPKDVMARVDRLEERILEILKKLDK